MFEIFEELCRKTGKKPSAVARDCGIDPSTISHWKKGLYTPKQDKLKKIADYFGVSLQFLMTGEGEAEIRIPADQVAADVALMLHENPVLIEMIYDFADIDMEREKRLKGYYDAIRAHEKRG